MIYAYGGFEAALFAAGETRNPRKDAPVALAVALSTAAAVYVAVQYIVVSLLPNAGASHMVAVDTYLLTYPNNKPANVEDTFYWARVKFGLKPTLRVVQMVTMRGNPADQVAYVIAEKQLYSSHYFETALDLAFCLRGANDPKQPGFYLIMAMGSEQAGLTGARGSIVRKAAVGRSVSNLQNALTTIRNTLQGNQQASGDQSTRDRN